MLPVVTVVVPACCSCAGCTHGECTLAATHSTLNSVGNCVKQVHTSNTVQAWSSCCCWGWLLPQGHAPVPILDRNNSIAFAGFEGGGMLFGNFYASTTRHTFQQPIALGTMNGMPEYQRPTRDCPVPCEKSYCGNNFQRRYKKVPPAAPACTHMLLLHNCHGQTWPAVSCWSCSPSETVRKGLRIMHEKVMLLSSSSKPQFQLPHQQPTALG